jgi:hypothetical protein
MNIINYINKYGDNTFEEKELNEVDKLIFALLSYVNYEGIVSHNSRNKKTIEEVGNEYFRKYNKKFIKKNIIAIRNGISLLDLLRTKKRYKNLLVYNYTYVGNDSAQFSAISIEINPKLIYVSFEGTDHLISGWEEDFKMSYMFPVDAQKKAIQYLNKHFIFKNCKLIVGGHSKGGNLALISSMYSIYFVRNKIEATYSYDGPGLRKEQFESDRYKKIESKFKHIIPNYSIIGLLLRHSDNYIVVKSNRMGIMAHDARYWQVTDTDFVRVELSKFSKILDQGLLRWMDRYDNLQREKFVVEVFNMFRRTNITSLTDITNNYELLLKIIKDISNVDKVVAKMLKELVGILIECNKENIIFYIKKSVNNKK